MKTVKELQQQIDQLQIEREKFTKDYEYLVKERDVELREFFKVIFDEYLLDDMYVEASDRGVKIERNIEGKWNKELITIYFQKESYSSDAKFTKLETSFYSTTGDSNFEFERMVLIGNIGKVLLSDYDKILERVNQIVDKTKQQRKECLDKRYDLDYKISEIKSSIKEIEKQQLFDKLEKEGLEFEINRERPYKMPSIDIRFDLEVRRIKSIKLIDKTKSGKSGTLEIETYTMFWNHEEGKHEDQFRNHVYKNVRMDNIEGFLNQYADKSISAS